MIELSSAAAPPSPAARPGLAASLALAVVRGYKILFSPFFTGSCRFQPSCSDYMAEAIRVHGAARGVLLGLRRLIRCGPWGGYGVDPVPHRH